MKEDFVEENKELDFEILLRFWEKMRKEFDVEQFLS